VTKWEVLEEWMFDTFGVDGGDFDNRMVAEGIGITGADATDLIQAHLDAQRAVGVKTLYMIYRDGRTTSAMWHCGENVPAIRAISRQLNSDFKRTYNRAYASDLNAIAEKNPRAAKKVEQMLEIMEELVLRALEIATDSDPDDE
jgi:hypothetical protein